MSKLAVSVSLAIAFALVIVASVGAQTPNIQIIRLQCVDDPNVTGVQELVEIENQGDALQQFAGWKLLSDPPETEVFDLVVLGGLAPGASVSIQSGPAAAGVFKWGTEEIFRDDDATDYVRLVDDTGAVIDEVSCSAGATLTPTPTPSPTPSPEPTPANGVPNGGGPPPIPSDALSPVIMLLLGGSMAVAGLAAITLPWIRLRR